MLINAFFLPRHENLEADVCIVGAGPAGISIAMELLSAKCSVIMLEGGGLRFNHHHQFMHRAKVHGRDYIQPETTRRRQFGGTSAVWSGKCRRLDPIDFETRSWVPHSGWPISADDVEPHWPRAHDLCGLGPYDYSVDGSILGDSGLEAKLFRFSHPLHFGKEYGPALRDSQNVRVLLHANAVEVLLNPDGGSVSQVLCATRFGQRFGVRARYFILAGGGLEVPAAAPQFEKRPAGGRGQCARSCGALFHGSHRHVRRRG